MGSVVKFVTDNLRSLVSGMGDKFRDKAASTEYQLNFLTDEQIYAAYRSSWIAKKAIDIPVFDALRKGRDWQADPDQITAIEAEENRLNYWPKIVDAMIRGRLFGGAALLIGTGDSNLELPIEPERIGKEGIKYLSILTKSQLSAGDNDDVLSSPTYGQPLFYNLTSAQGQMVKIHPSRLVRFMGNPIRDPSLATNSIYAGWGESVLESIWSAVKNADSGSHNMTTLLFEANVDVINIPNFMTSLVDPSYEERFHSRLSLAAAAKGINGMLILDEGETYSRKQISFAGIPDVVMTLLQIVSGAADIPITRFLGQSPAGLSSTGEGDMKNYFDRLNGMQKLDITPTLSTLDECLIHSALASRPPEVFYLWSPMEQMNDKEAAEIGKLNAEAAAALNNVTIFTQEELRKVVANQLTESGFYPGLEDAMDETGNDWEKLINGTPEEQAAEAAALAAKANGGKLALKAVGDGLTVDMAPRPLYVRRDVKNGAEILTWAKSQGFTSTLPAEELHITILYSKEPVDWMEMGSPWEEELVIPAGGPRVVEQFGEGAVVLRVNSENLVWRNMMMRGRGASSDHEHYHPHITITYDGAPEGIEIERIIPFAGRIELGPEIFEDIKDGGFDPRTVMGK